MGRVCDPLPFRMWVRRTGGARPALLTMHRGVQFQPYHRAIRALRPMTTEGIREPWRGCNRRAWLDARTRAVVAQDPKTDAPSSRTTCSAPLIRDGARTFQLESFAAAHVQKYRQMSG